MYLSTSARSPIALLADFDGLPADEPTHRNYPADARGCEKPRQWLDIDWEASVKRLSFYVPPFGSLLSSEVRLGAESAIEDKAI